MNSLKALSLGAFLAGSVVAQSDYDRTTTRCRELIEKQSPAAEEVCRLAVDAQPQRWEGHVLLGSALALANKKGDASTEFRKAAELAPADKKATVEALGQNALANAPTVGTPSSGSADAHFEAQRYATAGVGYYALRKYALAGEQFRAALRLEPSNSEWHFKLAQTLAAMDLKGEGANEYLQAANLDPSNPQVGYKLGGLLLSLNRNSEGLAAYRTALDKGSPESPDDLTELWSFLKKADPQVQREWGDLAPKLADKLPPGSTEGTLLMGGLLMRSGKTAEAYEFLKAKGQPGVFVSLAGELVLENRRNEAAAAAASYVQGESADERVNAWAGGYSADDRAHLVTVPQASAAIKLFLDNAAPESASAKVTFIRCRTTSADPRVRTREECLGGRADVMEWFSLNADGSVWKGRQFEPDQVGYRMIGPFTWDAAPSGQWKKVGPAYLVSYTDYNRPQQMLLMPDPSGLFFTEIIPSVEYRNGALTPTGSWFFSQRVYPAPPPPVRPAVQSRKGKR